MNTIIFLALLAVSIQYLGYLCDDFGSWKLVCIICIFLFSIFMNTIICAFCEASHCDKCQIAYLIDDARDEAIDAGLITDC